jgi:phospholipase C
VDGSGGLTRKAFLQRSGAALLGGMLWATGAAAARARRRDPPIRNLVICCQENRSFDHYFGFAPQVRRAGFGPPAGAFQVDAAGARHTLLHQTALSTRNPDHSWAGVHRQYGGGRVDGFYASSGDVALGYYAADDLPYYSSLLDDPEAALCVRYFCSVLGSSSPNHLYMLSGTSGGITNNGPCCFGVIDSVRWPIIFDLLDEAGVTWKVYNLLGVDDLLTGQNDNTAVFWTRYGTDPRTFAAQADYLEDCLAGTLPSVSWVLSGDRDDLDEHPPADVTIGMRRQQEIIGAVRASPQWPRTAYLLTYDEHGGFYDHSRRRRSTRSVSASACRCGSSHRCCAAAAS